MIPSDVEPISLLYHSEFSWGSEQAIGASGTGDGGDPSRAEGEFVVDPWTVAGDSIIYTHTHSYTHMYLCVH